MEKGTSGDVTRVFRLIDTWNVASVAGITMGEEDSCIVRAMMIPKHVYDKVYRHEAGNRK